MSLMSHPNVRSTAYALSCLLGAFVFSVLLVAGATKWLPEGRAGIDHIITPIVLFPLVWITLGLFLYIARRRARAWTIALILVIVHAGLVAYGFLT